MPSKGTGEEQKEILRGCIGTFSNEPLKKNLMLYSLISAFKDDRFPPISMKEVPYLSVNVSLLQDFEKIKDPYDWEIGKHGVQIDFKANGKDYGSTFLPEVAKEQGWDQKQTLKELLEKAEYNGTLESIKDTLIIER